jgi:hypothetical protein
MDLPNEPSSATAVTKCVGGNFDDRPSFAAAQVNSLEAQARGLREATTVRARTPAAAPATAALAHTDDSS